VEEPRSPRRRTTTPPPGSASPALRPLRCRTSTPPPRRRVQEREVRNPLDLVVDPAFEPRLDRALCARCMCVACCSASRRRADPPSLESRPSSRAGRLQVPLPTATRALLAWHRVDLVPTSALRVPARRWHPHTEHATVERRPCLSLAWGRVSTNPCRAHVVGVVPSPVCAADLLPAHTNTGSRPCPSWPNLCTRTHAHARSFAGVCPQPTPPGRSSPFSFLCSLAQCTPSILCRCHGRAVDVQHAHEHTQPRG
jgi:hypothetical protein